MKLFVITLMVSLFCACQSNHSSHMNHATNAEKVLGKDLICGMEVSDSTYTAEYDGKTYFFCAEHCKEEFLKEPHKYLTKNNLKQ